MAVVLAALAGPAVRGSDDGDLFRVERRANGLIATFDNQPLFEYRSDKNAHKPYVSQLFTPSGIALLQDAPPDHAHHHGLMFAVGVNDVNFWQETPSPEGAMFIGHQRGGDLQYRVEPAARNSPQLVVTQHLEWLGRENRPILNERRRLVAACEQDPKRYSLTWTSQLSAAQDNAPVVLKGERYYGLGLRFGKAAEPTDTFLSASRRDAEPNERGEKLIRDSWCAYVARENDRPRTVAHFASPRNPRHPPLWFTMVEPFAYLSATLDLQNHPLELPTGQTLALTYGVAAADGALQHDEIERLYQAWLKQYADQP